jgi:CRISPR-associated protein Csb1
MEYTAKEIRAYFNLDLALLRSYRLGEAATDLIVALALYKVRRFLSTGLRLRTACDFSAKGAIQVVSPVGFVLPDEADLLKRVKEGIAACSKAGMFASPAVTELTTKCVVKDKKKDEQKAVAAS